MEIRRIGERPGWREGARALGLEHEAERWDDGRYALLSARQYASLKSAAESAVAAAKARIEDVIRGERADQPWMPGPVRRAAIMESMADRGLIAVQRLDYLPAGGGDFRLAGVEVDPVDGFLAAAILQWLWIEENLGAGLIPADHDQFNRLNEAVLACVKELPSRHRMLHAVFDIADRPSAAMAGYMVNLGKQAGMEVRPVDYRTIGDRERPVDPAGDPISLCWTGRFPRKAEFVDHADGVRFTTPAWCRLLPAAIGREGSLSETPDGGRTRVSVWLVNGVAAAISCTVGGPGGECPAASVPHAIAG